MSYVKKKGGKSALNEAKTEKKGRAFGKLKKDEDFFHSLAYYQKKYYLCNDSTKQTKNIMKISFKNIIACMAIPCMVLAFMTSCCDGDDGILGVEIPDPKEEGPTEEPVTIEVSNVNVLSATSAEISATLPDGEISEAGAMVSTSENDFTNAKFYPCQIEKGATSFNTTVELEPNTTYYVGAYVVDKNGVRTISNVQKITTPEKKFSVDLLCGPYSSSEFLDYWTDPYTITNFSIKEDPEVENGVLIYNLDPYFYQNGFTSEKGYQIFKGTIDTEKMIITIPQGQSVGYQDIMLFGFDNEVFDEVEDFDDIHIKIEDFGNTLTIMNAFATKTLAGYWSLYDGGIVLNKNKE